MRFEFDSEADVPYIKINEGRVERTVELEEGVYADRDAEDRPLGLEFIALAAFDEWMKRHGTLNVPERVEGRETFLSPA
ncbi:MAG: DUF2283 domain-containing protein [Rubrobacteraceae bacterium]